VTARGSDFLDAPVGVAALDAAGAGRRPRIDLSGRNRFVGDTVAVTANNLRAPRPATGGAIRTARPPAQIVAQGNRPRRRPPGACGATRAPDPNRNGEPA
jgi:hypothetical protein